MHTKIFHTTSFISLLYDEISSAMPNLEFIQGNFDMVDFRAVLVNGNGGMLVIFQKVACAGDIGRKSFRQAAGIAWRKEEPWRLFQ